MEEFSRRCQPEELSSMELNPTISFDHEYQDVPATSTDQKRKIDDVLIPENNNFQGSSPDNNGNIRIFGNAASTLQSSSISGPLPKKRTLIQSQAEILRSGPSATLDRSRNTLFPSIAGDNTTDDDTSPGSVFDPPPTISSVTLSAGGSPENSRALTPKAHQTFQRLSLWSRKRRHNERAIKGMRVFEQNISSEVEERFQEVRAQLEPALLKFLQSKRLEFRPLSIQILVLGHDEEDAEPWIVVNCSKKVIRKVEKFLQEDVIKNMYHGPPSCRVRFQAVVGGSLIPSESDSVDEVFIEIGHQSDEEAGARQIQVVQSDGPHYATLGGFVQLIDVEGKEICYGLTAGHILPNSGFCFQDDDGSEDIGDEEEDEDDNEDDNTGSVWSFADEYDDDTSSHSDKLELHWKSRAVDHSPGDSQNDQLIRPWEKIGFMSKASYSNRARDRDWALVELDSSCDGRGAIYSGSSNRIYEAARPLANQAAFVNNRSKLSCMVSGIPARALLPSGSNFVDVYVIRLENDEYLQEGSSGSWIVSSEHADSIEVFGTLVAADSIGDLWIVPMIDILQDIVAELDVVQVALCDLPEPPKIENSGPEKETSELLGICASANHNHDPTIIENYTETSSLSSKAPTVLSTTDASNRSVRAISVLSSSDASSLCSRAPAISSDAFQVDFDRPNTKGQTSSELASYSARAPAYITNISNAAHPNYVSTDYHDDYRSKLPANPHLYEELCSAKSKRDIVWYCGKCGDGPNGAWQSSCPQCGHNGGQTWLDRT